MLWEEAPGAQGRMLGSLLVAFICEAIAFYLLCHLEWMSYIIALLFLQLVPVPVLLFPGKCFRLSHSRTLFY